MRQASLRWGILALSGWIAVSPGAAAAQAGAPTTRPFPTDSAVRHPLRGGESDRFLLPLGAHQFVRIVAQQHGIDVVVALRSPRGDSLAAVDSPNGTDGPEPLAFVTTAAGDYLVDVSALEPGAEPGGYTLAILELRAAQSTDPERIRGEVAIAAGKNAIVQETRASFEEALRQYRAALAAFEVVGDSSAVADALLRIGDALNRTGNSREAVPLLERGLALAVGLSAVDLQIQLLNQAGTAADNLDDPARALEYFRRVRRLAAESGDSGMVGSALSNSAGAFQQAGLPDSAIAAMEHALAISRALGDKGREAPVLNSLGLYYQRAGQLDRALEVFHAALDLVRQLGSREGEQAVLGNLGGAYAFLGADDQAIEYRQRALTIARERGDQQGEAIYLNNLAMSFENLADTSNALSHLRQAFALGEEISSRGVQARASESLGRLLAVRSDQHAEALGHLERAAELWRSSGDLAGEATTLAELADLLSVLGRTTEAWESYGRALALLRQTQQRTHEIRALDQMARLAEKEGELERAAALSQEAVALTDQVRSQVADRRLRTSYLATAQSAHLTRISILMAQHRAAPTAGYDRAAAAIVEQARSRGLLDALADHEVDVSRGIDPATIMRERSLGMRVDSLSRWLRRDGAGSDSTADGRATRAALDSANAEQQRLRAAMRAQNPEYMVLAGAPLDMAGVQALLDHETLLLSYSGGGEHVYMWAITRESVHGYSLAQPGGLVTIVRRYLGFMTERNRALPNETAAAWQSRLRRAQARLPALGDSLSQILLGPAAGSLGLRRVLIMASGVLQYLPFAALPIPQGAPGAGQPLMSRLEVVFLPSASTIGVLRELRRNRPPPPKTIAVVADPVFARDDPRMGNQSRATSQADATAVPSWRAATRGLEAEGPLPRLRFAGVEADGIAALVPAGSRLVAEGLDATRALVLGPGLSGYRIVHFATHGFVNSEVPELSGLAFSMMGRDGAPQDGYLTLQQIYGLHLPADLVVLSACQTALGKDVSGEGIVGLARGFLFAGAASVVATLWKVDDQASADLMTRFYRHMLGPDHLPPSAALRAAQAEVARQPRWRDPYFWAGYTLQGDWQ